MKLTRRETVTIEMESHEFDSLLFFIRNSRVALSGIDTINADNMYNSLKELNKV